MGPKMVLFFWVFFGREVRGSILGPVLGSVLGSVLGPVLGPKSVPKGLQTEPTTCRCMDFGSGWTIAASLRGKMVMLNLSETSAALWWSQPAGCVVGRRRSSFFTDRVDLQPQLPQLLLGTNERFHKACFGLWMGQFQIACSYGLKSGKCG